MVRCAIFSACCASSISRTLRAMASSAALRSVMSTLISATSISPSAEVKGMLVTWTVRLPSRGRTSSETTLFPVARARAFPQEAQGRSSPMKYS